MAQARVEPPLTGPKLFMIELPTADLEGSLAWYRDRLGLRVLLRIPEDGFALLDGGGVRLALKVRASGTLRPNHPEQGPMLVFEVQDAAVELERLQALGTPVLKPLAVNAEGYHRVVVADPDGHSVMLFHFSSATA